MALYIKNKPLHKKIYGQMEKLDNKALSLYDRGKLNEGKKYENRSHKLYADNWGKIWGIKKEKKR